MLTQSDADSLITMKKAFVSSGTITMSPGSDETYDLLGDDNREQFLLDLWRGTIRLSKVKYQLRGRKVIVLVRLDIDGAPHTNPDGGKLPCPHLHLYREGYEDKWAYPIDVKIFSDTSSMSQCFTDFCHYCNIGDIPTFQEALI